MLLKMLKDTDYVIQECNQIIAHIGTIDVVAPLTDESTGLQTFIPALTTCTALCLRLSSPT